MTFKELKTIKFHSSGRSSDYLFPSIVSGCAGGCSYCYAARHTPDDFYSNPKVTTNIDQIIEKVKAFNPECTKPNQTHEKYITWDIGVSTDLCLYLNHFDWESLFDYFKYSDRDMATFATKFRSSKLLSYKPERKIRVRPSLTNIPKLETNCISLEKRVEFGKQLHDAGYDVHFNFSPIAVYDGWEKGVEKMLRLVDVDFPVNCEVIFLTHNQKLHDYNVENKWEKYLWNPDIQECKVSELGGNNVRYKDKYKYIAMFKKLLSDNLPEANIRYIF